MERSARSRREKEAALVEKETGENVAEKIEPLRIPTTTSTIPPLFAVPTSRPLLTIPRPIVSPPTHHSHLLSTRTEILAQQLSLIERDLFRILTWQELVSFVWRDRTNEEVLDWEVYLKDCRRAELEDGGANGGRDDVGALVRRFNLSCGWVVSEVSTTFCTGAKTDFSSRLS